MPPPCPHCHLSSEASGSRKDIVLFGHFTRKSDKARLQRFRCQPCRRTFSLASPDPCFKQHKRDINPSVFQGLVSGLSQRRLALLLKVNHKTIVRKLIFLAEQARLALETQILPTPVVSFQFDDMETFEHTKLKMVSITLAVESETRRILGFKVASMPTKGLLAKKALKKYGPRKDDRSKMRQELFGELTKTVHPEAEILSDQNPHYVSDVKKFFPKARHRTFKGRRGCVVGQGELKRGGFDPLFSLNHTCAMFRANVNRLFRRTWNTTKRMDRLEMHLRLYTLFHNSFLLRNTSDTY